MGFEGGNGATFIAKAAIAPVSPGGHSYWKDAKLLVVEAQGYGHKVFSHLDPQYSTWLARHHWDGVALDQGCRDQCIKTWWVKARKSLTDVGIYVPGAPAPTGAECLPKVDLVFEQPYAPKFNCTGHRRQEKKKSYDVEPADGAVWADCLNRRIAADAVGFGMTASMSDAEADGTLAERLAVHGATVVVGSQDSDIVMYPLGQKPWRLVYPQSKGEILLVSPGHKLKAMAMNFAVDEATLLKHYSRAEVLYLSTAALTPHDYNYRQSDAGKFLKPKTNIGAGTWPTLMALVGKELITGLPVRNAQYKPVMWEVYKLIQKVKDSPGDYDANVVKAANRCSPDLLVNGAPAVVAAFLEQSVSPEPGSNKSVPYYRHFMGTATPKNAGLEFSTYTYEGKCASCPAEHEAKWKPNKALKRTETVTDGEEWGAKVKMPKLLVSDIIKVTSEYRHKVEMNDGFKDSLDLVLGLMGRASFTVGSRSSTHSTTRRMSGPMTPRRRSAAPAPSYTS